MASHYALPYPMYMRDRGCVSWSEAPAYEIDRSTRQARATIVGLKVSAGVLLDGVIVERETVIRKEDFPARLWYRINAAPRLQEDARELFDFAMSALFPEMS